MPPHPRPVIEPELRGALAGLKVAEPADLAAYDRAIAAGGQTGFGYFFPHILGLNRPGRSAALLVEDEGSICVFRWKRGAAGARLDLAVAPAPMNRAVMMRCLERANEYNRDSSARVLKVDAADAEPLARSGALRVVERKSQYLYSPSTYLDLRGNRFRGIRRYVTRFEQRPDLEIRRYTPRDKPLCLALLERWRRYHRDTHGTLGGVGATRRLLNLADCLGAPALEGEIIFVDGALAAFVFGGQLRSGVGVFSEAKSEAAITGLSVYQRYHFMVGRQHWRLVNDGPDVDRGGLAEFKQRLRPVGMHQEYTVRQD